MDQVVKLNYMDKSNAIEVVYQLENTLDDFPKFG